MRRGPRSRGELEAAETEATEVLAGRRRVDLRRLVELIRTVNPTGLDLPRAAQERRYATKSRLQSLLLRTFPDEVEVRPEPGPPEQVLLRLPRSGQEACHAPIDGLDPDVRARVRWLLDTADGADVPGSPPASSDRVPDETASSGGPRHEDRLGRGRAALEAYDFEAAREHLEAAFTLGRGAPAAALPLLELLVEHLADYPAARRLEPALAPEALDRPRVRALLAMAAAHTGDPRHAVRLLRDVDDTAAGDVLAVLAAAATRASELEAAQRHLDALRERCPAHPEVPQLASDLARARDLARRPLLDALRQALEREDLAEARAVAGQVLERWPDEALARRTLADLEARQQREKAAARRSEARQALDRGDRDRAAALAREARSLGGADVDLEVAIADAVEAARRRAEQVRVAEVADRLTAEVTEAGLLGYLELAEARRAEVRRTAPLSCLEWLEAARGGGRLKDEALVAAVLALGRAERALGDGDPAGALALLDPHRKVLRPVPRAAEVSTQATAAVVAARRAAAEAALADLRVAVEAGDGARAMEGLGKVDGRALGGEQLEALRALEAAARRLDEIRWRTARVATLAEVDPLAARDEVAILMGLTSGSAREAWQARRQALSEAVHRAFRWDLVERPVDGDPCDVRVPLEWIHIHQAPRLDPEANEIFLLTARAEWVFVCGIDAVTGECRRILSLRVPEPLEANRAQVAGRSLFVIGDRGAILQLRLPDLHVERWLPGGDASAPVWVEDALVAPGDRFLWLTCSSRGHRRAGATRIVDLERGEVRRELPECFSLVPLPSAVAPRVACLQTDTAGTLHAVDGARSSEDGYPRGARVDGVAPDPGSDGLLLLGWDLAGTGATRAAIGRLRGGRLTVVTELEGPDDELSASLITAQDERLAVVLSDQGNGICELVVLDAGTETLEELDRFEVSNATQLVQDPAGRRLIALIDTAAGPIPYPLVRPLPDLPLEEVERLVLPNVTPPFTFCAHDPEGADDLLRSSGDLARAPLHEQEARIRGWLSAGAPGVVALVGLTNALLRAGVGDRATEVLLRAQARHPGDPRIGLALAGAAAEAGRWAEVRRALEPVDARGLPASLAAHCYHLLGCAHLHLGDQEGARQVFAEGLAGWPEHCGLDLCLELATDLSEPLPEEVWDEAETPLRQLLGALRVADRCLAAADPDGARRLLWHEKVWRRRDRQCLARLAEACLRVEPVGAVERLRWRLVLASYVDVFTERFPVNPLFVPGGTWDQERLASLAERARVWLDRS